MAPTEPLFMNNHRDSSLCSQQQSIDEHAALLGRQKIQTAVGNQRTWRELGLFAWAVAATAAAIVLAVLSQHHMPRQGNQKPKIDTGKRNLIFMVSDGMGPASLSMARSFQQFEGGLPHDDVLILDKYLIGSSRTRSSSSLVTDSAAGATAFSCGMKSYNGAVSMLPDHTPCGTVLEAAKKAGYMTGLVVTTDITDATPACFASHVRHRQYEDLIAQQEIGEHPLGRVVDLLLGGGRCHFLPNTTEGSCRGDGRDMIKVAEEQFGWNFISNREGFDDLRLGSAAKLPLLGLFAESDIPYELDRRQMNDVYPSLNEMAITALTALEAATKGSDHGFFLMIEGSRIDHAGHGNDPAAQVREILAYDEAFASVVKFLERSETEGVLVATSDHETGGLSVARQLYAEYPHYAWYPEVLSNASSSASYLARMLRARVALGGKDDSLRAFVEKELLQKGLGVTDATQDEVQLILDTLSSYTFADMINRRSQIGWSTHGHSAVDVNIYGTAGSEILRGNHENTEIGEFLSRYLQVDVDSITAELNQKSKGLDASTSWIGPEEFETLSRHYE